MVFPVVLVLTLKICGVSRRELLFCLEFPRVNKKSKNSRGGFQKIMSKTSISLVFSGIAHSHMAEPMVTTKCFIALKSSKRIQLLCHY